MKQLAIAATIVVLAHFGVATAHGLAHEQLGVGLNAGQLAFIYSVITAAPLLAAILYWTQLRAWGALLLGTSMLGAMLFGIYYHLIAVSNDHLSHLPEGDARGFFTATALLLIPAEAIGAAFGFWSWGKLRGLLKTRGDAN